MLQLMLNTRKRKALRAQAHHLDPVVMIGADGLTPAVRREADAALSAHGLIKIRVLDEDDRATMGQQLASELNAAANAPRCAPYACWATSA